MTGLRIALALGAALACAAAARVTLPLGLEAHALLEVMDDPARLADHALDRSFNAAVAEREINAALAAKDIELAQSFLDLARDRQVALDPDLVNKVASMSSASATASRMAGSFGRGLITGEPDDLVGLAGTAVGDLFVFGDIRDAAREGKRLVAGEPADELILGLAGVGLAVTAGTFVSLGAASPARLGVSVIKAAAKTGRMSARMAAWIGRSLRDVVDSAVLRRAVQSVRVTEPGASIRAVRNAVNVDKAHDLVTVINDVGRVQAKAGTQAALDGLKIAHGPKDMAKVATLAAAKGGKTRAILKLAGRSAIMLTMGAFNLASWMFWAAFTVFGFVSSLKRMTERSTERYCARRRARIARAQRRFEKMQALAEIQKRAAEIDAADERPVIYSSSPSPAARSGRTEPTSLRDAVAALRGPLRTQVA